MVLKASAGMDYWEFAQFLICIAAPRLHCFEGLLKDWPSVALEAKKYTTGLKSFIQEVSDCPHPLTFFKSRVFPADLCTRPLMDNVHQNLSIQESFKLQHELPSNLKQTLGSDVQDNACKGELIFRAFEVYTLHSVAEQVRRSIFKRW